MKSQNKHYEIQFFDRIVFDDLGEIGDSILHTLYNLKIDLFRKEILDCGCGDGGLGNYMRHTLGEFRLTGLDICNKVSYKIDYDDVIIDDAENSYLFPENRFDVILSVCFLHHFPDVDKMMDNFSRWLKPNGYLIVYEPNGDNLINKLSKQLRKIIEISLGKDHLIRKKIATPNETDHVLNTYIRQANLHKFKVFYQGYLEFKMGKGIRDMLKRILEMLPKTKYNNSGNIILILKK